jgi:hypothetical protein
LAALAFSGFSQVSTEAALLHRAGSALSPLSCSVFVEQRMAILQL